MAPRSTQPVGILTITLTLLGWTSIPLFLRHFADHIDVWSSNGWRYGFSALLWAPLLVYGAVRGTLAPGLMRKAIAPSVVNAAGQVTFVAAHYMIEPGLLTFGLRSQLLFAAVGAYLLFPAERPVIRNRGYLVGMLLLLIGTGMAIMLGAEPVRGTHLLGILLAIASGLLFAMYGMAVRFWMHEFGSAPAFAAISQYTAAAMIVLMLLFGAGGGAAVLEQLDAGQIALLLLSAVIGIAMGHVLYYMSIARLGVAVSTGVLQLHPFLVAVAAWPIFGERLLPAQWAGGILALTGAILMLRVQRVMNASRTVEVEATEEEPR